MERASNRSRKYFLVSGPLREGRGLWVRPPLSKKYIFSREKEKSLKTLRKMKKKKLENKFVTISL